MLFTSLISSRLYSMLWLKNMSLLYLFDHWNKVEFIIFTISTSFVHSKIQVGRKWSWSEWRWTQWNIFLNPVSLSLGGYNAPPRVGARDWRAKISNGGRVLHKPWHLLWPTCLCSCLTLPSVVLSYFVDAHSQPEERSYCEWGPDGSRGNRCAWVFPKRTQTLLWRIYICWISASSN